MLSQDSIRIGSYDVAAVCSTAVSTPRTRSPANKHIAHCQKLAASEMNRTEGSVPLLGQV